MAKISKKTFVTYMGVSQGSALKHKGKYFVMDLREENVWLMNEFDTITRVSIDEVEPIEGLPLAETDKAKEAVEHVIERLIPNVSMENMPKLVVPNGKGMEFGVMKAAPTATEEQITETIDGNEIYRRVRAAVNSPQRTQVAYGIGKYPEPLNADTWTIIETINHAVGEVADLLHYLTMLQIKFEKMGDRDLPK
jgi:hypothetical protein